MSGYEGYPEYRDSGVEWISEYPSEWRLAKIKYCARLNPSKLEVRTKPIDLEVSFLPMEAIGEDGNIDASASRKLGDVVDAYTYVGEGDVCIAKITPCFENGKGAVATGLTNNIAFATTEVIPVRPFEYTNAEFIYYLLSCSPFRLVAEGAMYGAGGQKRVADAFVANYDFACPPADLQQKIANFLDHETAKIDTLIEKQQQLIKLLKEKRQAVISHAVTKGLNPDAPMKDSGVEWLGEVPDHWEIKKFSHVAVIKAGLVDPRVEPYKNYWLIAPNHIHSFEGKLHTLESAAEQGADSGKYLCTEGEIVYSKIRPALAKACLAPSNTTICSADMYPISSLNGMTNQYLMSVILTEQFTELAVNYADRVAMPKINREALVEIRLPMPPVLEQKVISKELIKTEVKYTELTLKVKLAISLMQERRTALISAAVTGKIDVRNWQPPESTSTPSMDA